MPNPGKTNPNYAHRPADAQRFDLSPQGRTWTKPKRGEPPVLIPAEYPHHSHPDPTPQPMIPESDLKRRLRERRRSERTAKEEQA